MGAGQQGGHSMKDERGVAVIADSEARWRRHQPAPFLKILMSSLDFQGWKTTEGEFDDCVRF